MAKKLPTTVAEAADIIIDELSPKELLEIKQLKQDDLYLGHFGLAAYIRDKFGLWNDNQKLLESSGHLHPDDCSEVIVEQIWKKLKKREE